MATEYLSKAEYRARIDALVADEIERLKAQLAALPADAPINFRNELANYIDTPGNVRTNVKRAHRELRIRREPSDLDIVEMLDTPEGWLDLDRPWR